MLAGWWDQDLDISQLNDHGADLLVIAAAHGDIDLCEHLLKLKFDVNKEVERLAQTPFGAAFVTQNFELFKLLLRSGADRSRVLDSSFLCAAAVWSRGVEMMRLFLQAGVDVNIKCPPNCERGACALTAVAKASNVAAAKFLIQSGADVNPDHVDKRHGSPLAAAANHGNLACVHLMVEHGANVNAPLRSGPHGSVLTTAIFG